MKKTLATLLISTILGCQTPNPTMFETTAETPEGHLAQAKRKLHQPIITSGDDIDCDGDKQPDLYIKTKQGIIYHTMSGYYPQTEQRNKQRWYQSSSDTIER